MSYAGAGTSGPFFDLASLVAPPFLFRVFILLASVLLLSVLELGHFRRDAPGRPGQRVAHLVLFALNVAGLAIAGPVALDVLSPLVRWIGSAPLEFADMPPLGRLVLSFLALDLALWLLHRASHAVPLLWRFHRVHHSDDALDVTTSLRFHAGDLLAGLLVVSAVSAYLGIDGATLAQFQVFSALVSQVAHANLRLPRLLERGLALLLVTPMTHAVHHAATPRSSNFASCFGLWDHLLGTYRALEPVTVFGSAMPGGERPGLARLLVLPFEEPPEERVVLGLGA